MRYDLFDENVEGGRVWLCEVIVENNDDCFGLDCAPINVLDEKLIFLLKSFQVVVEEVMNKVDREDNRNAIGDVLLVGDEDHRHLWLSERERERAKRYGWVWFRPESHFFGALQVCMNHRGNVWYYFAM